MITTGFYDLILPVLEKQPLQYCIALRLTNILYVLISVAPHVINENGKLFAAKYYTKSAVCTAYI